jgi:hypothetical protein
MTDALLLCARAATLLLLVLALTCVLACAVQIVGHVLTRDIQP